MLPQPRHVCVYTFLVVCTSTGYCGTLLAHSLAGREHQSHAMISIRMQVGLDQRHSFAHCVASGPHPELTRAPVAHLSCIVHHQIGIASFMMMALTSAKSCHSLAVAGHGACSIHLRSLQVFMKSWRRPRMMPHMVKCKCSRSRKMFKPSAPAIQGPT